jgi:arylsulfatase A-like enzyme
MFDRWIRTMICLAGLGVIALISWSAPAAARPKKADWNVLLITLDTTRGDRIGCYGYADARTPNIDALASRGVRFAKAYAPVPLTLPSHSSILTGKYPPAHGVRNNGSYRLTTGHLTLAEALKARGFATSAFVSSFTLDSRFGLDQGFDVYDDTFDPGQALKTYRSERPADRVVSAFLDWLSRVGDKRFFSWVHFFDPHLPYSPPPPFDREFKAHPYDGEIAFLDREIGRIARAFEEGGFTENTLVVLAGDHGEALGEKREIDHGLFLYEPTLRVPLIVRLPSLPARGVVISSRVRLVDLFPTVLDLLNIRVPKGIQGESLTPLLSGRKAADRPSYAETFYPRENYGWSELYGLIEGPWKYIRAPKPELYDLGQDPAEETNLLGGKAAIAAGLGRELAAIVAEGEAEAAESGRRVSPEEEERLRSLGYLGAKSDKPPAGPLPDPKDKIEDYLLYFRGNLFETRGEYDKAEIAYRQVLAANPDVSWNYVNLGVLLLRAGRPKDAVATLEEGRARLPESAAVLSHLMAAYLQAGRGGDALAAGEALLAIDPAHFDALLVSGDVLAHQEKWAEALPFFERALRIEPENEVLRRAYKRALDRLKKRPAP